MGGLDLGLVRAVCWALAILLFIIGAYTNSNFQELLGWGLALTVAGLAVGELPSLMKRFER